MQDVYTADIHEELIEISKELYFITNELVETNQKLHVIVTKLSSRQSQQSRKQPTSPKREK